MKRTLLAAALAAVAPLASAACTYPLDATAAQYAAGNLTRFPYVNFQSAEYTTVDTSSYYSAGSTITYQAYSDTGLDAIAQSATTGVPSGDVTLPTSGIVAFEMLVDRFPATADSNVNNYLGVALTSTRKLIPTAAQDGAVVQIFLINSGLSQGSYVTIYGGASSGGTVTWAGDPNVVPLSLPLPSNYRVGIYLNMNTRQVGYTVNGVDRGYLQNDNGGSYTLPASVQSVALTLNGIVQAPQSSPLLGTPVGGTLITDQSQFTQPFPAGTTDICSAGGNAGPTLPGGLPFPGKGKALGLQKNQP
jgi:hypothetical protein